jgi:hypothetical protein
MRTIAQVHLVVLNLVQLLDPRKPYPSLATA